MNKSEIFNLAKRILQLCEGEETLASPPSERKVAGSGVSSVIPIEKRSKIVI
jgi:hypothetical protein